MNILGIETSGRLSQVAVSTAAGSDHGQLFVRREQRVSHSQVLLELIDAATAEAGLSLDELDLLTVARGPGSFTGLRIGIAVAQGIAFARQLPVLPVSSLAIMAHAFFSVSDKSLDDAAVYTAIDARMGQLYGAWYCMHNGFPAVIGDEQVISPEHLHELPYLAASQNKTQKKWRLVSVNAMDPAVTAGRRYMVGSKAYQHELSEYWRSQVDFIQGEVSQPCVLSMMRLAAQHWQATILKAPELDPSGRLRAMGAVNAMSLLPTYLRDNVAS